MKSQRLLRLVTAVAIAISAVVAVSCAKTYDEDIQSLKDRVTAVENDIESLKSQIESGAFISKVTQSEDGITIELNNGQTYNVTNGKNGERGDDGTPGSIVEIGDNGNWFIDGEDTGMPSRGEKGDKGDKGDKGETGAQGPQGEKGEQGEQGVPGTPGSAGEAADAVYYYPGENGNWMKVTVNGSTSEKSEEDTGEPWLPSGTVTAVWNTEEGNLYLYNVENSEEPVCIPLSNKVALNSIAFVPEIISSDLGMGLIDFYSAAGEVGTATVTYRINPSNADISSVEWSFIDRTVKTKVAGDNASLLEIVNAEPDGLGGIVITVKLNADAMTEGATSIVALQAKAGESAIVSDYAAVAVVEMSDYALVNPENAEQVYPSEIPSEETEPWEPAAEVKLGETIDLSTLVSAYESSVMKDLAEAGIEVEYVYSAAEYLVDEVDQAQYVSIEDGVASFSAASTPVIKIEAKVGETVIATGYVKIEVQTSATALTLNASITGQKAASRARAYYFYEGVDAGVFINGENVVAHYVSGSGTAVATFATDPMEGLTAGTEFKYYYPYSEDAYISDGTDGNTEGDIVIPNDDNLYQAEASKVDLRLFSMAGKASAMVGDDPSAPVDVTYYVPAVDRSIWTFVISSADTEIQGQTIESITINLGSEPLFGGNTVISADGANTFVPAVTEATVNLVNPIEITSRASTYLYLVSHMKSPFEGGYSITVTTDKAVYEAVALADTETNSYNLSAGAANATTYANLQIIALTKAMMTGERLTGVPFVISDTFYTYMNVPESGGDVTYWRNEGGLGIGHGGFWYGFGADLRMSDSNVAKYWVATGLMADLESYSDEQLLAYCKGEDTALLESYSSSFANFDAAQYLINGPLTERSTVIIFKVCTKPNSPTGLAIAVEYNDGSQEVFRVYKFPTATYNVLPSYELWQNE